MGGISTLALLVAGLASVSAFGPEQCQNEKGPTQEERDQIHSIMETSSYDEWRSAVEELAASKGHEAPDFLNQITAENFDDFKQLHELRESGDREAAQALAENLGLEMPMHGGEHHERNRQGSLGIGQAESYSDWVADVQAQAEETGRDASALLENMTEEKFDQIKEVQALAQSGDKDGAKELAEQYGLERPAMKERKMHKPMSDAATYDEWVAEVTARAEEHGKDASDILANMTEEKFSQLQEVRALAESGDKDGAKELAESYGLERPERPEGIGKGSRDRNNQSQTQN